MRKELVSIIIIIIIFLLLLNEDYYSGKMRFVGSNATEMR